MAFNPAAPAESRDQTVVVHIFQYAKKNNSTAQARPWQYPGEAKPQLAGAYNCYLQAGTTMLNPVIKFNFNYGTASHEGLPAPTQLNYAFVQNWNRYYFIRDWTFNKGFWYATMEEDVLATWKDAIGATTQYVLRSTRPGDWNGDIADDLYPTLGAPTYAIGSGSSGNTADLAAGWYVVGVIGNTKSSVGAIDYLVMTPAQLVTFYDALLSDTDWFMNPDAGESLTEITPALAKALFNPIQYVVSVKWFPVRPPQSDGSPRVTLGWWTLPAKLGNVYRLALSGRDRYNGSVPIPKHPQAASRGNYLNGAPYSKYYLDWRPWGFIPLDANLVMNATELTWQIQVDFFTGQAVMRISAMDATSNLTGIFVLNTMLCVDFTVAQVAYHADSSSVETIGSTGITSRSTQVSGGVSGQLTQSVSAGLTGNIALNPGKLAGAVSQSLQGAVSANAGAQLSEHLGLNISKAWSHMDSEGSTTSVTQSSLPQCTIKGASGSIAGINEWYYITGIFYPIADEDTTAGRPVYKRLKIDGDDAFIKCWNVELNIPATAPEQEIIKNAMETGFWYEKGWEN